MQAAIAANETMPQSEDIMAERVKQLETTVLELGTEMFRLKHQVAALVDQNSNFQKAMKGLKSILDEKGIISIEDFELATSMGQATQHVVSHESADLPGSTKKIMH